MVIRPVISDVWAKLARLEHAMKTAMSQSAMNDASRELAKYWDRALEKEEEKVLASCDAKTAGLFKKVQQSWREFRQAEVKFQGDASRGGSIQPLVHNSTYAGLPSAESENCGATLKRNEART